MPPTLSSRFRETGTKFLIYPQPKRVKGFGKPETVYISAPPGTIKPGPEDERIYVVDAVKKRAYRDTGKTPPYTGPRYPPVEPKRNGHFDHLEPGTREFSSAAVFAAVRCVLEIWEHYLGRTLPWYFYPQYPKLEVIPRVESDNAWSRNGYIECGFANFDPPRRSNPFCENFDAVAHEVGHAIGWAVIGKPARRSLDYRANDEACADLVSIISSLHFESVVDRLLEDTDGNLYSTNLLSRIGHLRRGRNLFNRDKISTIKSRQKYALSLPFSGGAYDILVKMYEQALVDRGAISENLTTGPLHARPYPARVKQEFARQYKKHPEKFRSALLDARDDFARLVIRAWEKTPMNARAHAIVATCLSGCLSFILQVGVTKRLIGDWG